MSKCLVTGVAGFIGFHLSQHLIKLGYKVIGADNFNAYYDVKLKEKRAELLKSQGVIIHKGDLKDKDFTSFLFSLGPYSHVLHLGAQAGVRYSIENPLSYIDSNVTAFIHIFENLKNCPDTKCIYASSSSVYGQNKKVPYSEEDPVENPTSLYGASKIMNELIAKSYHHLFQIPSIGLRFFTVFGPWGRPDMAYYSFTKNILEEKPLTIYGKGLLQRDFTYIDDIISGILSAMNLPPCLEIFNLGNSHPHTVLDLVHMIEKITKKKAHLLFEEAPKADVPLTFADIKKSHLLLKFSPKTSLEEGMENFIDWYHSFTTGS